MSTHYVTVSEYADLAGVSQKTIRAMIEGGELPAHRFGRILRIDPEEAHAVTAYQSAEREEPATLPRRGRPRAVRGDFTRRARGLPAEPSRE